MKNKDSGLFHIIESFMMRTLIGWAKTVLVLLSTDKALRPTNTWAPPSAWPR
jgi:hypothetical protein